MQYRYICGARVRNLGTASHDAALDDPWVEERARAACAVQGPTLDSRPGVASRPRNHARGGGAYTV